MTVATPTTFEIKSANFPLVALLLKSTDLTALAREMTLRFGDIPDFFDQDALVIDLSPLQGRDVSDIDFPALLDLLGSYRLVPIAVKGGNSVQMAAALKAGLVPGNDAHLLTPRPAPASPEQPQEPQPLVHAPPLGALVISMYMRRCAAVPLPVRAATPRRASLH